MSKCSKTGEEGPLHRILVKTWICLNATNPIPFDLSRVQARLQTVRCETEHQLPCHACVAPDSPAKRPSDNVRRKKRNTKPLMIRNRKDRRKEDAESVDPQKRYSTRRGGSIMNAVRNKTHQSSFRRSVEPDPEPVPRPFARDLLVADAEAPV